ncbi:hypothetical protein FRB94_003911 [Tulasnella sp. JGI-2019a]|nr:hypothetical protein FRB94_003911 [Tulasnella sp. JGI-2019a]
MLSNERLCYNGYSRVITPSDHGLSNIGIIHCGAPRPSFGDTKDVSNELIGNDTGVEGHNEWTQYLRGYTPTRTQGLLPPPPAASHYILEFSGTLRQIRSWILPDFPKWISGGESRPWKELQAIDSKAEIHRQS